MSLLGPSPEDAAALVRELRDMIYTFKREALRELDHAEHLLDDTMTALQVRKPTNELIGKIEGTRTAISPALSQASRELQDAEDAVQTLHNIVMRLETGWTYQ